MQLSGSSSSQTEMECNLGFGGTNGSYMGTFVLFVFKVIINEDIRCSCDNSERMILKMLCLLQLVFCFSRFFLLVCSATVHTNLRVTLWHREAERSELWDQVAIVDHIGGTKVIFCHSVHVSQMASNSTMVDLRAKRIEI